MEIKGTKMRVQVWDTAGQERFRTITKSQKKQATATIKSGTIIVKVAEV